MADERAKAQRISDTAVELASEMSGRVVTAIAMTCGESSDLVRYIVGTAFVAVGAAVMRKYGAASAPIFMHIADGVGKSPEEDALDIVRGVYKEN